MKDSCELLPLVDGAQRYHHLHDFLYQQALILFDVLKRMSLFPTIDMLFVSPLCPIQLCIVPGIGLHRDKFAFLKDFIRYQTHISFYIEIAENSVDCELFRLNWDMFDIPISLDSMLMTTRLGSQEYLLYNLRESPKRLIFTMKYENYTSEMRKLKRYPNQLMGWTEAPAYIQKTAWREKTSPYYLCEQYDFAMVDSKNDPLATLRQVARAIIDLHNCGLFHLFISPLTIRQRAKANTAAEIVLVLPALTHNYIRFVYSFIPNEYQEFIAPEVKRQIKERISVGNMMAADVFSFSQVIKLKLGVLLETVALRELKEVVLKGIEENWHLRPSLSEVSAQLVEKDGDSFISLNI